MPGESDLNQLVRIFDIFGTPNDENWPDAKLLPDYVEFKPIVQKPLKLIFTAATPDIIAVLDSMLALNPIKRCTTSEALQMEYFKRAPGPTPCEELPLPKHHQTENATHRSDGLSKRKLSDDFSSKQNFRIFTSSLKNIKLH
jgi:cyclin-dependent kinase 7